MIKLVCLQCNEVIQDGVVIEEILHNSICSKCRSKNIESALRGVGISLKDCKGGFKSLYTLMDEIGERFR